MGAGVGWVCGRLLAGSGRRGLTVGGSSAVSPWCVTCWPLVGWLRGVFGVYRFYGGTTVCWRAAVGGVVGCGVGACVSVVSVVCGSASCVVLGGSSWRSVVAVRRGLSWAWRFPQGWPWLDGWSWLSDMVFLSCRAAWAVFVVGGQLLLWCAAPRVRCPGPPGSCSPVSTFGVP